jgi:pyrimidine-nucleoside phosphorylase
MLPQWIIEKKRDGEELDTEDIRSFISGYTEGSIPDYQMSALAMAIYFSGMTARETADLTVAMMESGTVIDPTALSGFKVDKHSTGGIGDKISIPLAPLVASCGATVPMISGRGLGITGGTLDKLESIRGYNSGLTEAAFLRTLKHCGCSMIGQTAEIVPADKKLYALRDVTATVPSIPLIVSSIMSKKMAEGIDALVLDVKCGSGAFMKNVDDARRLARSLVDTGEVMGKKVTALITDMSQPLGRAVGNALEIQESLDILSGNGPEDSRQLTLELASRMLTMAGIPKTNAATHLADGSALNVFREMVACHGGDLNATLPKARTQTPLPAQKEGYLTLVDAESIGRASLLLGAGRVKTTDRVDPAVGFSGLKKIGERVEFGEPLCMVHSNSHEEESHLAALLDAAFEISSEPAEAPPLIMEILDS